VAEPAPTAAAPRAPDLVALLALYLVWGSTYFAIRIALEGLPPFLLAGTRFILAGLVLLSVARVRGAAWPTGRQVRAGGAVGVLLCAATGLVTAAERDVSSSVAAVVVASMPLWTVVVAAFWRERPTRWEVAGLLVGLAGVVLLQQGGELQAAPLGAALLVLATWSWAVGSMWSRRLPMPTGLQAPGVEMLAGGLVLTAAGLLLGERVTALPAARPALAWLYLTVFGSLVAFSAYNFLLRRVRPALATSYAYVNPAVAVVIGAAAGEPVGPRSVGALGLILAGVGLVAATRQRRV
jgi:drug/metabolite transporter (DMT)-like permease